jgi:glycosyltransferase involved in cell wall biosynthesis
MNEKTGKLLSIVVPCYNEQEVIPLFYAEVIEVLNKLPLNFELLFIDDGSKDSTASILKGLAKQDERVKYLIFSRNFGKESALYAGLVKAKGDYVAVMDVDLQDPPTLLTEMFYTLEEGAFDIVATKRVTRKGEPLIRSWFARTFYKIINKMSKIHIENGARDFRMMTRKVVDGILQLKEYNRFTKGIFGWVGFDTKWIAYENIKRKAGKTKWSFSKLFKYSIEGIVAFTDAPLVIASFLGVIFSIISFIGIVFIVIRYLVFGDSVQGWASTITIITFFGGLQLLTIGILGQYFSKSYLEVKNRPIYIEKDSNISEE